MNHRRLLPPPYHLICSCGFGVEQRKTCGDCRLDSGGSDARGRRTNEPKRAFGARDVAGFYKRRRGKCRSGMLIQGRDDKICVGSAVALLATLYRVREKLVLFRGGAAAGDVPRSKLDELARWTGHVQALAFSHVCPKVRSLLVSTAILRFELVSSIDAMKRASALAALDTDDREFEQVQSRKLVVAGRGDKRKSRKVVMLAMKTTRAVTDRTAGATSQPSDR
nr:hypothetical protein CFP56_79511 [Quercus suber]